MLCYTSDTVLALLRGYIETQYVLYSGILSGVAILSH